ncbi:hypothetical protein GVN20_21755 [Runella sp. CRIBMP]|uniref:hypothetical protein n=1 Tax=Runella sp. CRIBMP TaxID=2683261 RepID=UPI001412A15E|nr:hypothetical protein [Runella sp. CRIBMP]NBB21997.1 hypothetical protein [Runella sp. CRIBMP]
MQSKVGNPDLLQVLSVIQKLKKGRLLLVYITESIPYHRLRKIMPLFRSGIASTLGYFD